MRSTLFRRRLLALLFLPLLSTACATTSTRSSLDRTERPKLADLPAGTTQTVKLKPLAANPSDQLVTIDKAVLAELVDGFAQAVGGRAPQRSHHRDREATTRLHVGDLGDGQRSDRLPAPTLIRYPAGYGGVPAGRYVGDQTGKRQAAVPVAQLFLVGPVQAIPSPSVACAATGAARGRAN